MTKPKPWLAISIVLLICVVCLAAGISWFLNSRPPAINFANFLRIEQGMSESEVHELLGVPPGDDRVEPGFDLVGPGHIHVPPGVDTTGGKLAVWYIPRFHVEVFYNREGGVQGKYWHDENSNRSRSNWNE